MKYGRWHEVFFARKNATNVALCPDEKRGDSSQNQGMAERRTMSPQAETERRLGRAGFSSVLR